MSQHECDVLILGGSFTGIELVRRLRRDRVGRTLRITVIDRQAEHPYIPLGHELLCERMPVGVEVGTVLASARYVDGFGSGVEWVRGEITGLDPLERRATLADGQTWRGRFVVIALGSEIRPPAGLLGGARLLAYKSEAEFDEARRRIAGLRANASVVVVGGGITGVEIAGELAWQGREVTMIHGGDRLLPGLHARAGRKALAGLRGQAVEVELDTRLLEVREHECVVRGPAGERTIACELGFWAGGLQPPPVLGSLGVALDPGGWIAVDPTLRCGDGLFAGGDVARVYETPAAERPWPNLQRAIEGIFAAKTLATNIAALVRGSKLRRHPLWTDFPHGVSVGRRSLFVYGRLVVDLPAINVWFRRFLMHQYMRRYRAIGSPPNP